MTTDLIPASDYTTEIERSADPAEYVVQTLERAKVWLAQALDHGDIEQIVELKSQAEAIRVYTMSKQLGKDAELSAAEIVRRAERGIGVAIRRGQEAGEIRDKRSGGHTPHIASPADFVPKDELKDVVYPLTDDVTDDDFEDALAEAKEEGNLSRANVVRKVQKTTPRPAPAPEPPVRNRRPLVDTARESGWALRRDVEKIERLFTDDRFAHNKQQVATQLRSHLTYAVETLTGLIDCITQQGE